MNTILMLTKRLDRAEKRLDRFAGLLNGSAPRRRRRKARAVRKATTPKAQKGAKPSTKKDPVATARAKAAQLEAAN
jgi:hypothetical protein